MADQNNSTPFGDNDLSTNPLGTAGNAISGLLASLGSQLQKSYPSTSNTDGTNIGGVNVSNGTNPQNPVDPKQLLASILPTISQQQNPVNPLTGLNESGAQILQKTIDKAMADHAQNFVNTVGPAKAQQFADLHAASSQPNQNNSQGSQDTSIMNGGQAMSPLNIPQTTQPVQPSVQQPDVKSQINSNIDNTLLQMSKQPSNWWNHSVREEEINNLRNMKTLNEGQPADIALPQAEANAQNAAASEIQQKINGAVPLQEKDILDLNVGSYSAAVEANHAALTAKTQKLSDISSALKDMPVAIWDKARGQYSPEGKKMLQQFKDTAEDVNNLTDNMSLLASKRQKFTRQNTMQNKNTDNIVNQITEGTTATNKKTGAKIIYKGGKWLNQ